MSDERLSQDNNDIRKVLEYSKQAPLFFEANRPIENIATSVTATQFRKWKDKMKTSVKPSSKGENVLVSALLFQRLVVLANGFNISLDEWKRHEL